MKYADLQFEPHWLFGTGDNVLWTARMRRLIPACADWTDAQIAEPVKIARVEFSNGWILDVLAGMISYSLCCNWQTSRTVMCQGTELFIDCDWSCHETIDEVEAELAITEAMPNAIGRTEAELRLLRTMVEEHRP